MPGSLSIFSCSRTARGVKTIGHHIVDTRRVGFPFVVPAVRGVDDVGCESSNQTRRRHSGRGYAGSNQRAYPLNRIGAQISSIHMSLCPMRGFMPKQRGKFIYVVADKLHHRNVDSDDAPLIHQAGECIGFVSFDNDQLRLRSRAAGNANVRQQDFLNRCRGYR